MSSIVLYGPPGSGKTTMACTMAKLGYEVLLFDADQKAEKMMNIQHLLKTGQVKVVTMQATLVEGSLKDRILTPKMPPRKQPQGYLEFVAFVTKLQEEVKQDAEKYKNTVLVIDSATTLFSHMRRLILQVQGRGAMEIQDWGIILSNLEELFSVLFTLPFKHVILIAHDQAERDELIGKVEIKPLIDGQMKNKVGLYVEEMYYMQPEITKDKAVYQVMTKPVGRVTQVRTSRNLKTYEPADFSLIFKEG
jgi:energy-coupling factor transporter ATP-binding protein EcfA2